jgi:hypothetical protein
MHHAGSAAKEKNWYCENKGVVITVNASSYTVITADPPSYSWLK